MKHALSAVLFALLAAVMPAPAAALETGTPAWTTGAMTLFQGPGTAYDAVGNVASEQRVYVERCQKLWCRIRTDAGTGWVTQQYLAYGHEPKGPFTGPRLDFNTGDNGTVCLYSGRDFTGTSICGGAGFVVRDLLLHDADNRWASVAIEGDVSVMLCRDRFFLSYCQRFNESQSSLPSILINSVSSLRIYGAADGSIGSSAGSIDAGGGSNGSSGSSSGDRKPL